MAALSANSTNPPRREPGSSKFEGTFKAHAADEFYVGSVVCATAGRADLANTDALLTIGICMQRTTTTAQDNPVKIHIKGVWWIACAQFADGDLRTLVAPASASDNPADLVCPATGAIPGALGMLIHLDVTGTSGWVDLDTRVADTNSA